MYLFEDIDNTYECRFGSTINLQVTAVSDCSKWTFNGKIVPTECVSKTGFEKKECSFKDSGIYIFTIQDTVKNVFKVLVYGRFYIN